MTNPAFNPDDPRLTAFALGELDGADRDEIEKLIAASPEASVTVEEIRDTIGLLSGELAAEPTPELTESQRAAILDGQPASEDSTLAGSEGNSRSSEAVPKVMAASGLAGSIGADEVPRELASAPSVRSFPWAVVGSLGVTAVVMVGIVSNLPDFQAENEMMSATPSADMADETVVMNSAQQAAGGGFAEGESYDFAEAEESMMEGTEAPVPSDAFGGRFEQQTASRAMMLDKEARKTEATPAQEGAALYSRLRKQNSAGNLGAPDPASVRPSAVSRGLSGAEAKTAQFDALSPQKNSQRQGQSAGDGQVTKRRADFARPQSQPGSASPSLPLPPGNAAAPGEKAPASPFSANTSRSKMVAGRENTSTTPAADAAAGKGQAAPGFQIASVPRRGGDPKKLKSMTPESLSKPTDNSEKRDAFGVRTEALVPNEAYEPIIENDFVEPRTTEQRLSTFSIDVDTASYSNVRRFLNFGQLPPPNAVRIEELINYFSYDYKEPQSGEPFAVDVELQPCPWAAGHRLARVGIKAKSIDKAQRPPTSLVFMIDVSGSMRSSNKLPLVKKSIGLLVNELTEDDQVSIVAYASNAGLRLDATSGDKRDSIMNVVNGLVAGGSTNGEGGIRTAYDTAIKHFIQGGSNRVIMCTDGDFNVGVSDDNELVQLIEEKAASGVFLSIFGFGMGNLKDAKLEKLADKGNGHYGYMDSLQEAQKVFGDQVMGTLYTVAKDVKIQVEFNPSTVGAYRLIGYENRKLAAQDFHDDTKDAGEIGAGHTVTALYEIVPKRTWDERPEVKELRYGRKTKEEKKEATELDFKDELMFVKLNYKKPDEETSTSNPGLKIPVNDLGIQTVNPGPSPDFMWAASVASFGMNLRNSKYRGSWDMAAVLETVEGAKGDDELRVEFAGLVRQAMSLIGPRPTLERPEVPEGGFEAPPEMTPAEARHKASVSNKYRRLLKKIEVPADLKAFGGFYDYGLWEGASYAGHSQLPKGHWVYVFPNWYIWGEVSQKNRPGATPEVNTGLPAPAETPDPAAPVDDGSIKPPIDAP